MPIGFFQDSCRISIGHPRCAFVFHFVEPVDVRPILQRLYQRQRQHQQRHIAVSSSHQFVIWSSHQHQHCHIVFYICARHIVVSSRSHIKMNSYGICCIIVVVVVIITNYDNYQPQHQPQRQVNVNANANVNVSINVYINVSININSNIYLQCVLRRTAAFAQ